MLAVTHAYAKYQSVTQKNKGTKEQRNKGTKEQRNKGTKEQRCKGKLGLTQLTGFLGKATKYWVEVRNS
jgi:hypothetical protein